MPRAARKKSSTGIYHIMLRGINRQQIFEDEEDRQRLLETLLRYRNECGYTVYAYCLMGNHFHILLKEGMEELDSVIKRIAGSYVYWYNWKYRRTGHLFQDRFKRGTRGRFCCLLVPNGNAFSYDGSGNLTNDGTWAYTWRQGRQLATMTDGYYTWNYTHDANGMRLKCTIGTDTSSSVAATALAAAAIGNGSKPLTANGYEFQMAKYSHDNHKNNDYHGNDH